MKSLIIFGLFLASVAAEMKAIYEFPEWWLERDFDADLWVESKFRDKRIIGGQEATPNQFPYHVGLLLYLKDSNDVGLCGGALISTKIVLTAAHCVDIVAGIEAVFGAHSLVRVENAQIRRSVTKSGLIMHEGYMKRNLTNDVALLKISTPVPLNNVIQVVSLPKGADLKRDYVGAHGVVSGWGIFSSSSQSISKFLRFIDVTVITNDECRIRFPTRIRDSTSELSDNRKKLQVKSFFLKHSFSLHFGLWFRWQHYRCL